MNLTQIDHACSEAKKRAVTESLYKIRMSSWLGFEAWCEAFDIKSVEQLKVAPKRILKMLKHPAMKKKILNHLLMMKQTT